MTNSHLMLLDSCSIVNLYASAQFEAILTSLDGLAAIVELVRSESQYVRNLLETGEEEKEQIQLDASIASGRLRMLQLETETEFTLFLELGVRLDDGEAATLAVAASRGGTLITDDHKALSIADELAVPTLTTPDVLHRWSQSFEISEQQTRVALENIRFRARYEPGKRHPRWPWWQSVVDSGHLP